MKIQKPKYKIQIALFFLCAFFYTTDKCIAEEKDRYFEIGMGIGTNIIQSLDTEQILIAPAVNWRIMDDRPLIFRLEGDMEIINDERRATFVIGAAPFLRLFSSSESKTRPFIEGGVGLNFISNQNIGGRKLGGSFIFSPMAGIGFEFKTDNRPITISYRYRHISNAGIYEDNEGIDSHYLMLSIIF